MKDVYGYVFGELAGDYARAFTGFALCALPFTIATPVLFVVVLLAVIASVFLLLLCQTVSRHISRVIIDDEAIELRGGWKRRIAWNDLSTIELSYFTTWNFVRSRAMRAAMFSGDMPDDAPKTRDLGGWMELKLKGGGTTMRIGSSLQGFRAVARIATTAANRNGVQFSAATIDNLQALGIANPAVDP